jgi:hypothetical protein
MNHGLADVRAVEITDSDAAIARPVAVELAPQSAALNQLEHCPCGSVTTQFVALGRGQAIEPDRHAADHDRVAISNVGDWPGQAAARTISSRGGPGKHQDKNDRAQEAAVSRCLSDQRSG